MSKTVEKELPPLVLYVAVPKDGMISMVSAYATAEFAASQVYRDEHLYPSTKYNLFEYRLAKRIKVQTNLSVELEDL